MFELVLLGALALLLCLNDPRLGMFLCVLIGFLADPLRKLIPGEPVFLSVVVVGFVAATFAGARKEGLGVRVPEILSRYRDFKTALALLLMWVVVQSGTAFLSTGSPIIAGIGLVGYLAPLPAVLIAFHFGRCKEDIFKFMVWYVVLSAVSVSGVYLSLVEYESDLLEPVGVEQVVYSHNSDGPLRLLCGFLRSSENAAWHAATAFCLLILLAVSARQSPAFYGLVSVAVPFFAFAIFLTGRRKALVAIVVYIAIYTFSLAYFRKGAQRLAVLLLLGGLAAAFFVHTNLFSEEAPGYRPYLDRGLTATGDNAFDRLRLMTVDSFKWVVAQNGILGAGAGTGSQGAQYFGGGVEIVGGSAEGGLGKVLAELGIPGLVLLLWLFATLLGFFWRELTRVNRGNPTSARMAFGLLSLLGANVIEFATAHQIYGDPFVLFMLGSLFGFLLAIIHRYSEHVPNTVALSRYPLGGKSFGQVRSSV